MIRLINLIKFLLILALISQSAYAKPDASCRAFPDWFRGVCLRLNQVWQEGRGELYFPTYAWHNRLTYTSRRLHRYNEFPFGGGLGKSFYDENGNWHGLYFMAFQDSHKNVEPVAGYAFLKIVPITEAFHFGVGYTLLVTGRPDIFGGIPFAGILPWISFNYDRVSLSGTYIPGAKGAGNVLFLVLKYLL